jgi:hypothetical protein
MLLRKVRGSAPFNRRAKLLRASLWLSEVGTVDDMDKV